MDQPADSPRSVAPPISRFPVPDLAALPDDVRARIQEVQDKAGFVPNVFLVLAHRPDEFRAFFAYHDALMLRESGLTKAEREMIVVAVAGANDCLYCFVAHGAILRIYAKNPLVADQVGVNYLEADITLRRFAPDVVFDPMLCAEHITRAKPAPDGLIEIQRQKPGAKLWYVGDTVDDARSARAAGVPFIGVASKHHSTRGEILRLFEQAQAVAVVENVNEIEGIV